MVIDTKRPSRRMMLAGMAATLGAAAAVAAPMLTGGNKGSMLKKSWWNRMFVSLKNGGVTEWNGVVGSTFLFQGENGPVTTKLLAVKPLDAAGRRPTGSRSRAFVAVFETGAGPSAQGDRTYSAVHPRHGSIDIFMGPSYAAAGKARMEAIFN